MGSGIRCGEWGAGARNADFGSKYFKLFKLSTSEGCSGRNGLLQRARHRIQLAARAAVY